MLISKDAEKHQLKVSATFDEGPFPGEVPLAGVRSPRLTTELPARFLEVVEELLRQGFQKSCLPLGVIYLNDPKRL